MKYNLAAEMARKQISQKTIYEKIGISQKAFYEKMHGIRDFNLKEILAIRDTFFPDLEIEYLFASDKE